MSCDKRIKIVKGDSTGWNNSQFLRIILNTDIDLSGFTAKFSIGGIDFDFNDITSKNLSIELTAEQTDILPLGIIDGSFVIYDTEQQKKTLTTCIPFLVIGSVCGDVDVDEYNIEMNVVDGDNNLITINITTAGEDLTPIKERLTYVEDEVVDLTERQTTTRNDLDDLGDQVLTIQGDVNLIKGDYVKSTELTTLVREVLPSVEVLGVSGEIELSDNKVYSIAPTGAISFILPTISDLTTYHTIIIQANITSDIGVSFGVGENNYLNGQPTASIGRVDWVYEFDNNAGQWFVGEIIKGA